MNTMHFTGIPDSIFWQGSADAIAWDEPAIRTRLLTLSQPCHIVRDGDRIGLAIGGERVAHKKSGHLDLLLSAPAVQPAQLGDPAFLSAHGVAYPYYAGSMANGIASEDMVIALGREKILGSFGAAGLSPDRIETAIRRIQSALPQGPYASCLIHSPSEPALERAAVDLYLTCGVSTVEASAFLELTPNIVAYRAAGLRLDPQGDIQIQNRIIAKISRREVAAKFLHPAPDRILKDLVTQGRITQQQAQLAEQVPMADDITAEADSGGHTDNRPLVCLLPSIQELRDDIQKQRGYAQRVRVGAAGGIGAPAAALGAFMMGADYIATGSVNQACVEAGTSAEVKRILAQADMADVLMAPAADMFEMGVKLQVLKRGTLFPMRAQKLYELYRAHQAIEDIPDAERTKLEQQIFRKPLDEVWRETVAFFEARDPEQIRRAEKNPKRKMALIFRWYLGLSSHWANTGASDRAMDYQIWCGPAMGAFNDWTRNTYLAQPENRHVADVAHHLMTGACYLYRIRALKTQGLHLPPHFETYQPTPFPQADIPG